MKALIIVVVTVDNATLAILSKCLVSLHLSSTFGIAVLMVLQRFTKKLGDKFNNELLHVT